MLERSIERNKNVNYVFENRINVDPIVYNKNSKFFILCNVLFKYAKEREKERDMITISKNENTHKNTYSIHLWFSIVFLGSTTSFLHYLSHFVEYLMKLRKINRTKICIYRSRDNTQSFRADIMKVNIKSAEKLYYSFA